MSWIDVICVTGIMPQPAAWYPEANDSWEKFGTVVSLLNEIPVGKLREDMVNRRVRRKPKTSINLLGSLLRVGGYSRVANCPARRSRNSSEWWTLITFSPGVIWLLVWISFLHLYLVGWPRPDSPLWVRRLMRCMRLWPRCCHLLPCEAVVRCGKEDISVQQV